MSSDPLYDNYWTRKRLRSERCPHFPLVHTSGRSIDGQLLALIAGAIANKERLLDVGAGDLAVRDALIANGFSGKYETLDIGHEFDYTYQSLEQSLGAFDGILLLDVLEHLPLRDGLALLSVLVSRLSVGGVLVVQTPNARCVRSPFVSDMTHIQAYNLPDLWAYVACLGMSADGYRVAFRSKSTLLARLGEVASRLVATRLLGLDYADNILLIAHRALGHSSPAGAPGRH